MVPDLTVDPDSNSVPQPATRVPTSMPGSVGMLLAPRIGLADQWLAGRSFTRRSSCAFAATMMVDTLIATARHSWEINPSEPADPPHRNGDEV